MAVNPAEDSIIIRLLSAFVFFRECEGIFLGVNFSVEVKNTHA